MRATTAPTLAGLTRAGEQVVLRAHRDDDAEPLVEVLSDAEAVRWLSGPPQPFTRDLALEWIASRPAAWAGAGERTLVVEVDGRLCGQVGLRPRGDGSASLGYVLGARARRRGVMTAAVRALAAWALRPEDAGHPDGGAGLAVLHWSAQVGNWASRRTAWACGFQVEGRVRGLQRRGAGPADGWIGSLCRGDDLRPAHPWLVPERIETGDLVLRAHRPDDAERIQQACSDAGTQAWLPDLPSPYSLADAREYLDGREEEHAQAGAVYWAVADAGDDRLLGEIGLMALGRGLSRSGEIGYWVHPGERRRGVGARALRAVARHGLLPLAEGGLGLDRVLVRVAAGNQASHGVARSAGFTEVGRDRRAERLRDGRREDLVRYDLLAEELESTWAHPSSLR